MIKALRLTLTDDDLARGDEREIDCPPTIVLPDGTKCVYIEMNDCVYYLDDTTDEQIAESGLLLKMASRNGKPPFMDDAK